MHVEELRIDGYYEKKKKNVLLSEQKCVVSTFATLNQNYEKEARHLQ